MVTWDPRGEFASCVVLQLDSPQYEGQDAQQLITWVAGLNGVELDGVNDPTMGMVGVSYGGGIQLVTAASDDRVDAIAPGWAWNTLPDSLYPDKAFRTSYSALLLLGLVQTRARITPQIYGGILTGASLGILTPRQIQLLQISGPGETVRGITVPLGQGRRAGGPHRIRVDRSERHPVGVEPAADRGRLLVSSVPTTTWNTGKTLPIIPFIGRSGPNPEVPLPYGLGDGSVATNAVTIDLQNPSGDANVVGPPHVVIDYSGLGTSRHIYAQVVDKSTGLVVGNIVTPVPVTLNGRDQTAEIDLNDIAYTMGTDSQL